MNISTQYFRCVGACCSLRRGRVRESETSTSAADVEGWLKYLSIRINQQTRTRTRFYFISQDSIARHWYRNFIVHGDHIYIYTYIYIFREKERERAKEDISCLLQIFSKLHLHLHSKRIQTHTFTPTHIHI